MPPYGARHSRQRGSDGRWRMTETNIRGMWRLNRAKNSRSPSVEDAFISRHQVRVLLLHHRPVLREHRLRDRHEGERLLHVARGLDAAARHRHRDVLLALEVAV